jgi:hypothetical protein
MLKSPTPSVVKPSRSAIPNSRPVLVSTTHPESNSESIPRVMNLAEAARFVRCSRSHLCNVLNGKVRGVPSLAAVRIGRRVLFRREALEKWLLEAETASSENRTPS